jgi:hypothetical protein
LFPFLNGNGVSHNTWTVQSGSSTNPQVAQVAKGSDGMWYVVGLKEGKATISIVFRKANGYHASKTFDINVKNEALNVTSIVLNKSRAFNVSRTDLSSGLYLWDEKSANKITVTDQYFDSIEAYHAPGSLDEGLRNTDNWLVKDPSAPTTSHNTNDRLNLIFYIDDIKYGSTTTDTADTVTVDPHTALIKYTSNGGRTITSFRVKPSGISASFDVILNP